MLDWLPTLVNIAGGAKGDALKKQIEAGQYPGIVKTTLDGVDQVEYLSGRSEKSARDTFFYYSGKDPSAVRYKNWTTSRWCPTIRLALLPERFPITGPRSSISSETRSRPRSVHNTRRSWARAAQSAPLRQPMFYDWNMLPIGQALWLKELETYAAFPPLQDPASYNLDQVIQQIKQANCRSQRLTA